jgi:hypothetical protein
VDGSFSMAGGKILNCVSGTGSAIVTADWGQTRNSTVTLSGGEISGCWNPSKQTGDSMDGTGGTVYIAPGHRMNLSGTARIHNNGTKLVQGVRVTSSIKGGGIYLDGELSMSGGSIEDNSAINGAGIYMAPMKSRFTMAGSQAQISGNQAVEKGGGVYIGGNGATFTLNEGTIKGNRAGVEGAGVYTTPGPNGGVFVQNGGSLQ